MESKKTPFFARFLENQISTKKMETMNGGATQKFPSDSDEAEVTMKAPSDSDEGNVTMKHPSDSDEYEVM